MEEAPLPGELLGVWDPAARTITLASGLTQAQARAVLAHELEHARHDDRGGLPPVLDARRERQTEQAAARALIGVDDLVDALLWCRGEAEMAWHLHVDRAMVRARLDGLADDERAEIQRRLGAAERGTA